MAAFKGSQKTHVAPWPWPIQRGGFFFVGRGVNRGPVKSLAVGGEELGWL